MAGLLGDTDWTDPANQGLLQFGLSMLAGSGPSTKRTSVGQLIGLAGGQGMDAFNVARRQKLLEQESRRRDELAQAQLQEILAQAEERKRELAVKDAISAAARSSVLGPQQISMLGGGGPSTANAATMDSLPAGTQAFDQQGFLNKLMGIDPIVAISMQKALKEKEDAYTLKPGERRYVNGKEVAAVPDSAEKPPAGIQEYNFAVQQGYKGSFQQWITDRARAGAAVTTVSYGAPFSAVVDGKTLLMQPSNRAGEPPRIVTDPATGKPVGAPSEQKPMTDTQANANLYSARMEESDKIIKDLEGKYNRTWLTSRQLMGDGAMGAVANSRLGPNEQMADQAQRDFINAVMRRESGAVISPTEFTNARQQYFPQPGDSPEVIRQKERNRRTAIEGIRAAAGPAGARERDQKRLRYNPETGMLE